MPTVPRTADGATPAMVQWFASKADHPDALPDWRCHVAWRRGVAGPWREPLPDTAPKATHHG
mgnify:CR=1 FL=1